MADTPAPQEVGVRALNALSRYLAAVREGQELIVTDHGKPDSITAMPAEIHEVEVDAALLAHAEELAEQEALRGYDAVHLASSLFAGVDVLVTADAALIEAGRRCGLTVIDARS
jgi:hypothetical protein